MPDLTCVTLPEALEWGEETWDRLSQRAAASPFAGWAWHQAWTAAAPPEELSASRVVALRGRDGTLEALLPVAPRSVSFRRRKVPALTWAIGDVGCPDHLEVLATPEAEIEALVPALMALPWDLVQLQDVLAGAPNASRLAAALARAGCTVRRETLWPCPYLDLPDSWDAYLASLSPSRRQRLRRMERVLHRDHDVALVDYGPDRLEDGWRWLVRLHERRWDGNGAFTDPQVDRLHRAFSAALARRGRLWLATLDVDGTPAAAWYGFAERDTVYFYQSGRDPRRDHESVGGVLMAMMIRRAIERGYRRFDFLRGDEPYKRNWTTARRWTTGLVAFRPGWRGRWLRGLDLAARVRARLRAGPRERPAPQPA